MKKRDKASFRDPSGEVFYEKGRVWRKVNKNYQNNYEQLMSSGLYGELTSKGWLIKHRESQKKDGAYKIIEPEKIAFISYPYEWCFSQLKEAALLTLKIAKTCLKCEMSLKDASAYNVQFVGKKPVFIDSLSFEKYVEGQPWVAYRQFCRHFLAPLALMAKVDEDLGKLMSIYIDGIPLELASKLLPRRSKFNLGIWGHIVVNAGSQKLMAKREEDKSKYRVSRQGLENIITSLELTIEKLQLKSKTSWWSNYYQNNNYNRKSFGAKIKLVNSYFEKIKVGSVLDMGGNTGLFGDLVAKKGIRVISADNDIRAVETNYVWGKSKEVLPLVVDFTNPSAGLGWANSERRSFWERLEVEAILMLAVVHHLAIANNVPLEEIMKLVRSKCRFVIVEFIEKEDSQVKRLLRQREDVFPDYNRENFEKTAKKYFKIIDKNRIGSSYRYLYLMEKK